MLKDILLEIMLKIIRLKKSYSASSSVSSFNSSHSLSEQSWQRQALRQFKFAFLNEHAFVLQPLLHLQEISSKTLDGAESQTMYSGWRKPSVTSNQPLLTGDGSERMGWQADFQIKH